METIFGIIFLTIIGLGIHDNVSEEVVNNNYPENDFFIYDEAETFYKYSYNLSFNIKENQNGKLVNKNSLNTSVYSPEPQFHDFNFALPGEAEEDKFSLKMQLIESNSDDKLNLKYKIKIFKSLSNGEEQFIKEMTFSNSTEISLYDEKEAKYDNLYVSIKIDNVKPNKYYLSPEQAECYTDYCNLLKNNTINLLTK